MLEYLVSLLLIFILWFFYTFYFAPKRKMKQYKKELQQLGYTVDTYPFKMFGSARFSRFRADAQKYGDAFYTIKNQSPKKDICLYNVLSTVALQIINPDLLKDFFQPQNPYLYYKMEFIVRNIRRSLGFGIAFSEGKQWKRKRAIMNAVFNYDFITDNIQKIVRICQQNMVLQQKLCIQNNKISQRNGQKLYHLNLLQLFSGTFSNVMLQCFFGVKSTNKKIQNQSVASFINKLNFDISRQNYELPLLIFGIKFANLGLRQKDRSINKRIKLLRQFGSQLIQQRLKQMQKTQPRQKYQDIIQALVLKKNFSKQINKQQQKNINLRKNSQNYDYKELIQQFCTFFTAGTDTTSQFTQMMIIYILKNEKIYEKLRKQIDQVIKTDEDINKENLKKLTYLDWIQNQTTRYYGPGTGIFTRIAQKDNYIGKIPIKKGTALMMQMVSIHYNENYYKDPLQFRPERWQSQCNNNHPFAFGGFGGGPRSCIGKHLALLQSKIAVVKLLKRYQSFKIDGQVKMVLKFMYQPEPFELLVNMPSDK